MQITQTTSFTIAVNGQNYSFTNDHPIVDLISQYDNLTSTLALWNQRATDTQTELDAINAQIQALCVTPV